MNIRSIKEENNRLKFEHILSRPTLMYIHKYGDINTKMLYNGFSLVTIQRLIIYLFDYSIHIKNNVVLLVLIIEVSFCKFPFALP